MRNIKIGTIVIFALMIGLPFVLQTLGVNLNVKNSENRKLEERPIFTLKATKAASGVPQLFLGVYRDVINYKDTYDRYYKDNFVLKNWLFYNYYFIQNNLFGLDPLPQKVVTGTNGWLFLGNSYSDVITESKGIKAFNEHELKEAKRRLLAKKAWLAEKGIEFYVAVAPNKHSIYGDELPIIKSDQPTKLEQLKAIIQPEELNFIDLADSFPKEPIERLYHKTNTHWNDYGAFYGYKALMAKLKENYPFITTSNLEDFKMDTLLSSQEDLTSMLNINMIEERINLNRPDTIAKEIQSTIPVPKNKKDYVFNYITSVNKLKVLVFRDSFFSNLMKFMKENFGETIYVWSELKNDIIEKEQPDIVILEVIERDVDNFLWLE